MSQKDKSLVENIVQIINTLSERDQGYLMGYADCLAAHAEQARAGERRDSA